MQLHAEAHVGLVAAVFAHGIFVEHVRERSGRFDAGDGACAHHHLLDDIEDVLLAREGHLDVELREFGLAVGAQIFVAKTFDDLEIAVEAADHQDLLEDLRRLRQRVELAVMHAAGNEIVARAFGRGAREHRRFDFEEAHFVHDAANLEKNFVAQREIGVLARTAQIEIAIAQARFFGGVGFVFDLKRRRFRVVEDVKLGGDDFDFAAGEIGIRFLARDDFAFDGDDVFAADVFGFAVRFGLRLFVKDDLDDAGAIANVEEEEISEVAAASDPAHHDGVFVGVGGAEIAAVVCAGEVAEGIEHGRSCVLCLGCVLVLTLLYVGRARRGLQRGSSKPAPLKRTGAAPKCRC